MKLKLVSDHLEFVPRVVHLDLTPQKIEGKDVYSVLVISYASGSILKTDEITENVVRKLADACKQVMDLEFEFVELYIR